MYNVEARIYNMTEILLSSVDMLHQSNHLPYIGLVHALKEKKCVKWLSVNQAADSCV